MSTHSLYQILFLSVISFDRISKSYALMLDSEYYINCFCSFRLIFNRGIMAGALQFDGALFWLITACIILVYGFLVHHTVSRFLNNDSILGEVMVLAGGFSNIIDRFLYGGVVDFILLSYGQWSWPIFNAADAAIVIGVMYMIFNNLKS